MQSLIIAFFRDLHSVAVCHPRIYSPNPDAGILVVAPAQAEWCCGRVQGGCAKKSLDILPLEESTFLSG